jgi:dynein heavy chain
VDEKGRLQCDSWVRESGCGGFPPVAKVFDYYVEAATGEWNLWESQVPAWVPARAGLQFSAMVVPTVDTVRNSYVVRTLLTNGFHTLVTGDTGTGKTVLASEELDALPPDTHSSLTINFSAASLSKTTQDIIEGACEKASKNKLRPTGGKTMVVFIDDFNMPKKTSFESPFQPPLELLRLWMDYGGWYDREKQAWRYVADCQVFAAMVDKTKQNKRAGARAMHEILSPSFLPRRVSCLKVRKLWRPPPLDFSIPAHRRPRRAAAK